MINTKQAPRRELEFKSLDELKAELDRIDAAHAAGNLGKTGNWSPAQNLEHLGSFWTCSLDGFPPGKPPLPLRIMAQLLFKKKAVAGGSPPPGFPIPKGVSLLIPDENVELAGASEKLRNCIHSTENGDAYVPESPLFGKVTREQWTTMHLGHCALHLGFVDIQAGAD